MLETSQENLKEKIAELYNTEVLEPEKRYYGAHGTISKENAEKILQEGIVTMHAYDLGRTCQALPENSDQAAEILTKYEHRQPLKYIVVVSYKAGIRDHQVIEEDVPELVAKSEPGSESYNQYVHRIPVQFIKGYFDVEAGEFIRNPSYNSSADPVTLRRAQFPQASLEDLMIGVSNQAKVVTSDSNPNDWMEDSSSSGSSASHESEGDDWNF